MTTRERAIVSAYTGYLMCEMPVMHKYIKEKMERPVSIQELQAQDQKFLNELSDKVRPDFLALCEGIAAEDPDKPF